jgi:hypothetical protein
VSGVEPVSEFLGDFVGAGVEGTRRSQFPT